MSIDMMDLRILIIVPAYQESGNIVRTVGEIQTWLKNHPRCRVLVVNDGSEDETAGEASAAGAEVVSLPFNLGIGGAVQTGYRYAVQHGYSAAVQVDGDGQHDIAFLDDLLAPILDGTADITVGSRFIGPYTGYRSSFVRRIGIQFFARMISAITGYKITDPTSGFRAVNARALTIFKNDYPSDYPEPESIVTARRMRFKLVEVPVKMRKRVAGNSSIRYLRTLYYMIKVTIAILMNHLRHTGGNTREC